MPGESVDAACDAEEVTPMCAGCSTMRTRSSAAATGGDDAGSAALTLAASAARFGGAAQSRFVSISLAVSLRMVSL